MKKSFTLQSVGDTRWWSQADGESSYLICDRFIRRYIPGLNHKHRVVLTISDWPLIDLRHFRAIIMNNRSWTDEEELDPRPETATVEGLTEPQYVPIALRKAFDNPPAGSVFYVLLESHP